VKFSISGIFAPVYNILNEIFWEPDKLCLLHVKNTSHKEASYRHLWTAFRRGL